MIFSPNSPTLISTSQAGPDGGPSQGPRPPPPPPEADLEPAAEVEAEVPEQQLRLRLPRVPEDDGPPQGSEPQPCTGERTPLPTNTRETIAFVYGNIWVQALPVEAQLYPQLENLIFVLEELEQTREQVEMMYTGTDR